MKIRFYDPDDAAPKPAPVQSKVNFEVAPKKGITLDWVRDLGWRENPFTLTPLPAHRFIVNQDAARQAINLFFIKEQQFGTITGDEGSGKSFLLQWIGEELTPYKDRYSVHRIDATSTPAALRTELTQPYVSLFTKYRGEDVESLVTFLSQRAKRKLVLLIDNANALGALRPYIDALAARLGAVIILAGTKPEKLPTDSLAVRLAPLSADDANKLVERRIAAVGGNGIQPFTQLLLTELWNASDESPVQFLQFCNDTAVKIALKQLSVTNAEQTYAEQKTKTPKKAPKNAYDDLISDLMK